MVKAVPNGLLLTLKSEYILIPILGGGVFLWEPAPHHLPAILSNWTCILQVKNLLSRFHSNYRFDFDFEFLSESNWNIICSLALQKTYIQNDDSIYISLSFIYSSKHMFASFEKVSEITRSRHDFSFTSI